ncbi:MAG: hypothetical protein ACRDPF_03825 [Streptosporangiaceae bacterium]
MSDDLKLALTFGPDQPQRFLTAWLGPPPRDTPDSAASDLPAALANWHQQASRWDPPVTRQNRVPASREMDGEMLLVGVENQAVWLWGVPDGSGSPPVWERENEPGASWTRTGERPDEFLWHFTLVEAVFSGRFGLGANDVSPARLARFTSAWTALPVKPWRWPGPDQALWTQDGLLAWTMVNDQPDSPVTDTSTYSIFVSARSNRDLTHIDDARIAWDQDSRDEP